MVRRPCGRLSRPRATPRRSPGVSSIAFGAQPPDLRFASLMDLDFAMCRPLVRRLRLISSFCSSARTFDPRFLQTPPRDGSPCVSLTLHLHQVGWKTFTSELLSMPGTRLNRSRGRTLRLATPRSDRRHPDKRVINSFARDDPMIKEVRIWKFVAEHQPLHKSQNPGTLDRDCAHRRANCSQSRISTQQSYNCG